MMKTTFVNIKLICALFLTILSVQSINAQCYEHVNTGNGIDMVGMGLSNSTEAQSLSCEINTLLGGNFKVYDATFYTITNYTTGFEAQIEQTISSLTSAKYLFVYKITDNHGLYNRFGIKLKLPLVAGCLQEENLYIKELELLQFLKPYSDFESSMIEVLEKLKTYVTYMVNECCYASSIPPDCGGNVCKLRPGLVDELEFEDQYMIDWFNNLEDTYKCETQILYDSEKGSDSFKEEIRFALYYKYVSDNDKKRLLRATAIPIKECVEDSGLEGHLNDFQELESLYQSAFESQNNGINKNSGDCGFFEVKCYWEKGKEFVAFCNNVKEALKSYVNLALGNSTYFAVAEMIFSVLIDMSPIGDIQDIIEGIDLLKMGEFTKGLTIIGLAAVSLAANLIPWAKVGKFVLNCVTFMKYIVNKGVIKYIKPTANKLKDLINGGAKLKYKDGKFDLEDYAGPGSKFDFYKWCEIRGKGCFARDTPVLMANNPFKNVATGMALAAMPIIAVPIQEVQLLDYAVAHETVNSTYGLTASVDDDIYLGLMDKDPYTSDQQRERDEYEINDTDWNEVVFEEVNGSSTAKLALHNDWINQKGYLVDGVVNLDLPEMGISGPFRITSIKHIIPQKKPVDDEADEYGYKPVTGLFIHAASDVWSITFDNGEELGVTHNHPIYSTTLGDWQFAGMLQIGEEVLTKSGGAKVISKEAGKAQKVYNLEVKDYHNFLVNHSGIVVHNNGLCSFIKALFAKYSKFHKLEPDNVLRRSGPKGIDDYKAMMRNNDPFVHSNPIYTTTHNGKTYLWDGHHRLKAAKELKSEGIDFELQIHDINPSKIGEASGGRFQDITDLINQSVGPNG